MKIKASERIGPHSLDLLSFIYSALLGDAFLERRFSNVRICFRQESSNVEYLFWL